MKVATVLLNEDRKLSPNEAICADKRAYSRAVLVYTDAVALLQHHRYWGDDAYCVRCAADLQNIEVRGEPVRVRIRTGATGPSRKGAPRASSGRDLLAFCANVLLVAIAMSEYLSEGMRTLAHGSEGARIHRNGSITKELVPYKSNHKMAHRLLYL
jgi:hypothetical protein